MLAVWKWRNRKLAVNLWLSGWNQSAPLNHLHTHSHYKSRIQPERLTITTHRAITACSQERRQETSTGTHRGIKHIIQTNCKHNAIQPLSCNSWTVLSTAILIMSTTIITLNDSYAEWCPSLQQSFAVSLLMN